MTDDPRPQMGRPTTYDEPTKPVMTSLPESLIAQIDDDAEQSKRTRSAVIRDVLIEHYNYDA